MKNLALDLLLATAIGFGLALSLCFMPSLRSGLL